MSVLGRSVATGVTGASDLMPLPRSTLSARPAHRRARGIDAVLLSFDKKVQLALRQLAFERLDLESRKRAVLERLSATEQRADRDPDILQRLNTQLGDNEHHIRRLAKDATPVLMAALRDPEVQALMALQVPTEEDAEAGGDESSVRLWRRRLESRVPTRVGAP